MKHNIVVYLLVPLISGCVGLGVGVIGTYEHKHDIRKKFSLSEKQIREEFGKPDAESIYKKCKVMTYYDGYSWSGILGWVAFFPLPLMIPTGHDEKRFYLRNGRTVGRVSEDGEVVVFLGIWCGDDKCHTDLGPKQPERPPLTELNWCTEPLTIHSTRTR